MWSISNICTFDLINFFTPKQAGKVVFEGSDFTIKHANTFIVMNIVESLNQTPTKPKVHPSPSNWKKKKNRRTFYGKKTDKGAQHFKTNTDPPFYDIRTDITSHHEIIPCTNFTGKKSFYDNKE